MEVRRQVHIPVYRGLRRSTISRNIKRFLFVCVKKQKTLKTQRLVVLCRYFRVPRTVTKYSYNLGIARNCNNSANPVSLISQLMEKLSPTNIADHQG